MTARTIENVRVFDGDSLGEPRAVHLDGGEIVPDAAEDAEVVDGTGRTLLPGFIDAHVHVESRPALEQCAHWGVTTALDMATPHPDRTFPLRHTGGLTDLFSAGFPAVAPNSIAIRKMGYPACIAVRDAADFVADRVQDGVDYLKVIVEDPGQPGARVLSPETIAALTTAAHGHGLKVIAHTVTERTVRVAVDCGVDVITHVPMHSVVDEDLAREVRVAAPTLVMMRGICSTIGRGPVLRLLTALRIAPRMDFANSLASVRRLHEAGATILVGTDANADESTPFSPRHGESFHQELALLVEAGLTPAEALRAATRSAADVFGLKDRGAIEVGRRADLVLVDGDPTTDIRAARRIRHVWAGGVQVR